MKQGEYKMENYYKEEAKKEIERRKHEDEMIIKAWEKVERYKTKDGKDFKNLSQNFTKGAIEQNTYNKSEKDIHVYIQDENWHGYSDEMSLSKTIYSGSEEEKKYKEEGRLIERGQFLHPYIEATPDEIEEMIKERIKYYKELVKNYEDTLNNFDKIADELNELTRKAKEIINNQPSAVKYILEKMYKEERQ